MFYTLFKPSDPSIFVHSGSYNVVPILPKFENKKIIKTTFIFIDHILTVFHITYDI